MTLREYVQEHYPDAIDVNSEGGVRFCPDAYPGLEGYDLHPDGCSADEDCNACWSQEYREPSKPKPKKKLNWSVGFLGGAALEALFAGVDLFRGNWAQFRFCCVMGLLYLIAAGVWRDNR